jgi:hypothetical protein
MKTTYYPDLLIFGRNVEEQTKQKNFLFICISLFPFSVKNRLDF